MNFILAFIPILLILVLMIGLRWSAARAGAAGYLCAMIIAVFSFGSGLELIAYAHAKAFLLTLDVLLVIWAAFLLYRVADEAGAIRNIGMALPLLTPDVGLQAIIIGWIFASFLQGVGGFGVPVAVISPILVGLGFSPLAAVVIPSIGHGWAVTFGSMGSSFQALLAATGQSAESLAPPSAGFLGISCLLVGIMVTHAAGGWSAVRRLAVPVLLIGVIMALVQFLVATRGPWNIGAFSGSLVGMIVVILMVYWKGKRITIGEKEITYNSQTASETGMKPAMVTLSVQLIPSIKEFLGQVVIKVHFPEVSTSQGFITPAGYGRKLNVFGHTGMILLYSSILAYLFYYFSGSYTPGSIYRIIGSTVKRVMSSSVSIASMVAMAVVMEHAGMTDVLARGLAQGMGEFFPLVSPWIGALGAFMTGSNTNSNVVFGALQLQTAQLLGYSIPIILAAQTAGAAVASVMAPTKVVVGASTAGMAGKEGEVMRKLVIYALLLVLLVSFFTAMSLWFYPHCVF
jgi:lactate permease